MQRTALLQNRAYLSVAMTHFAVDVMNNSRTLLIAILALQLGMTNTQVALVALLYNVGSALLQPGFGWLADRWGPRWLVVGGLGWMIVFYVVAALAPPWPAVVALTLAGFGSGAFHPTGTMVASRASRERRTQATAFFFTAGQLGLFIGPVLAGFLLEAWDRPGFVIVPLAVLAVFLMDWRWLPSGHEEHESEASGAAAPAAAVSGRRGWMTALLLAIILTSSSVSLSILTFAPKLFAELGYPTSYIGWLTGLYMMGSAAGGIVGAHIADRFGGKWAIVLGMGAGIWPAYFFIPSAAPWQLLFLLLAGFFIGMPHSVLVIQVQSMLPGRQATASGLTLGVMFFGGSLGSTVLGAVADQVGLAVALQNAAWVLLVALGAAILYPRRKRA